MYRLAWRSASSSGVRLPFMKSRMQAGTVAAGQVGSAHPGDTRIYDQRRRRQTCSGAGPIASDMETLRRPLRRSDGLAIADSVIASTASLAPYCRRRSRSSRRNADVRRCLGRTRNAIGRGRLRQVTCFDTAFHRDLVPIYHRFALPLAAEGRRRVSQAGRLRKIGTGQICAWSWHIWAADAAICAIHWQERINTTMGFSLDGLMMATRATWRVPCPRCCYLQPFSACRQGDQIHIAKSGLLAYPGSCPPIMRTLQC